MAATGIDIALISEAVAQAARDTRIVKAYLFGSYARGEADEGSDVDLLIETERGFSLFDAAKFRRLVSEDLGVDVDVVSERSLSGSFGESVQRDAAR